MSPTAEAKVLMQGAWPIRRFGKLDNIFYHAVRFISPRVTKQFTPRRARSIWEGTARRIDSEEMDALRAAIIEEAHREQQELRARLADLDKKSCRFRCARGSRSGGGQRRINGPIGPNGSWKTEGNMMQNSVPLIVDSFAGGGGASTGIEMALGRSPDIAINHNADALALHAANHPETLHLSENIFKVDPLDYVAGQHVGLAWFSPDCKHFSKAKGGKPVERNIRDLAWVIVLWAERAKPDVIIMENVEEWKEWGPLIETDKGLMPCPDSRGQTFQKWCRAMKRAGYKLQHRELRACDYGAPTIRKRLFVIARRDGKPIVWPVPTHGAPTDPDVIAGRKLPWRTAAEIIDWSLPCPSIFDTSDEVMAKHGLRAIRPLADATMARVARGAKRYVLDAARPFIVNLTHGVRSEDLDRPFNTITGANRGEKAVISPSITRFNSGATGSSMDEPAPTVTANSYIKKPGGAAPLGVIAPSLSAFYGPGAGGQDRSLAPRNRSASSRPKTVTLSSRRT